MTWESAWEPTWAEFWATARFVNTQSRRYGFWRAYAFLLVFLVMHMFASILKVAIDTSAAAVDRLAAIRRIAGVLERLLLIIFIVAWTAAMTVSMVLEGLSYIAGRIVKLSARQFSVCTICRNQIVLIMLYRANKGNRIRLWRTKSRSSWNSSVLRYTR